MDAVGRMDGEVGFLFRYGRAPHDTFEVTDLESVAYVAVVRVADGVRGMVDFNQSVKP